MGGVQKAIVLALAGAALAGCTHAANPADEEELAQVKRERAALQASVDELGVRLIESQHRVSMNLELRARHEQVSQVACHNLDEHWAGINRFLDNQRDKERKLHASRVAQAGHSEE